MVAPGGGCLTAPTAIALEDALRRLLDDAPARDRMGAAGRRFVAEERSLARFHRTLRDGLARLGVGS
jgi:glycosyltransferase involved in cell wall biosynthesis